MRKFVIASVTSIGMVMAFGGLAEATNVTVHVGPNHHRHAEVIIKHKHHHRHCVNKKIIKYKHGKRIVTMKRVCR